MFLREQSIVALVTPVGNGPIALIRISGSGSIELVDKIARLSSKKKLSELPTHTIHHGKIVIDEAIDEVLFLLMRSPKTFTGEDVVEISTHNNQFIIDAIINGLINLGARYAQPGEFSKRAFLNNKIDLLQAEAINELINAQNGLALKQSLAQLNGSLSSKIIALEKDIINFLSLVESSFEFLDEEQRDISLNESINSKIDSIKKEIETLLTNNKSQEQIKNGVRIALVGNVNAGKSTLFNRLVGKDRAIVSQHAGTTRDTVEMSVYKNGIFWTFVDTAGIRKTNDAIEQEGIERSLKEVALCDIVILVNTPDEISPFALNGEFIEVINKCDLLKNNNNTNKLLVSGKTSEGLDKLNEALEEKVSSLFSKQSSPFLLNKRQFNILCEINTKFKNIEAESGNEIIAYHLREILENISELTGKGVSEQVLDNVFSQFCVGK